MRLLCSLLLVAACGDDIQRDCQHSTLTYQTFGQPFMESWCNGCHSAGLPPSQRQAAPIDVNFDSLDEIRAQSLAIVHDTTDARTMPPQGGPSDDERTMLSAWVMCGAPP